jgi:hypothetical protein
MAHISSDGSLLDAADDADADVLADGPLFRAQKRRSLSARQQLLSQIEFPRPDQVLIV